MEYYDNKERYINPFTDFGFKKLFGTEMNKELLISFLNALLEGKEEEQAEIAKLTKEERDEYAESVKVYRDLINVVNTAERKGKKQGFAEGRAEGLAEGIEKGLAEGIEKGLAEGIEKGLAEGIEKGLAEGRYAANVDNARKMKADGLPPELVAKYSGLSIDEVEQL